MKTRATEELPNDLAVLDHGEAVTSARSIELLLAKLKPAQAEAIRLVSWKVSASRKRQPALARPNRSSRSTSIAAWVV